MAHGLPLRKGKPWAKSQQAKSKHRRQKELTQVSTFCRRCCFQTLAAQDKIPFGNGKSFFCLHAAA